jgi:hypothetical protein
MNNGMAGCGTALVAFGVLGLCLFPPAGIVMIIIGLLMGILGAVSSHGAPAAPAEHTGPSCPSCHGPLDDEEPEICRHCRSKLFWTEDGDPLTDEAAIRAYKHAVIDEAQKREKLRRMAAARENVLAIEREQKRQERVEWADRTARATTRGFVGIFTGFDGLIRKASGEGNEIVYRFFQVLVYVGIPAAAAAVTMLSRR